MAIAHLIPESGETRTRETHPILVRITPTVQRDYLRRGVFPHIRACNAARMDGATAVFFITEAEAEAILKDAAAQCIAADAPRGTPKAFGSLSENLAAQVDRERNRGLIPDPGYEAARARDAEGWRPLKVGDIAVYRSEFVGGAGDGETLSITRGYSFRDVKAKSGSHYRNDGSQLEYRWGYVAKILTGKHAGKECFFPAYQLQSPRSEITHLRLVD